MTANHIQQLKGVPPDKYTGLVARILKAKATEAAWRAGRRRKRMVGRALLLAGVLVVAWVAWRVMA